MLGHIATLKIVTMCAQNADVYSFDYLIAVLLCDIAHASCECENITKKEEFTLNLIY